MGKKHFGLNFQWIFTKGESMRNFQVRLGKASITVIIIGNRNNNDNILTRSHRHAVNIPIWFF